MSSVWLDPVYLTTMSFHTRLTPIAKTSPGEIRVRHRIFQKERVDRSNGKRMTIVKVSIIERSFLLLLSLLTTPQLTKPCVTSYLLLGQVIQDRIPICLLVFTGSCPIVTKSQPFYSNDSERSRDIFRRNLSTMSTLSNSYHLLHTLSI